MQFKNVLYDCCFQSTFYLANILDNVMVKNDLQTVLILTQSHVVVARFSESSLSLTCHILLTKSFTSEVNSSPAR